MSEWVKVDTRMPNHPKLVGLDDAEYAMHSRAICYAGEYETDGFVPDGALPRLSKARRPADVAAKLVRDKLWHRVEGGYQIHDYLEHQVSRNSLQAKRREIADRVAASRDRKRNSDVTALRPANSHECNAVTGALVTPLVTQAVTALQSKSKSKKEILTPPSLRSEPPLPGGTPEEPARAKPVRRKAAPAPDDFAVTPELSEWAAQNGLPAPESELAAFLDFHRGKGSLFADWTAAFRTWLRNAKRFSKPDRPSGTYPRREKLMQVAVPGWDPSKPRVEGFGDLEEPAEQAL